MTRDGAAAARVAHNHEVPGSSPGPATKEKHSLRWVFFFRSQLYPDIAKEMLRLGHEFSGRTRRSRASTNLRRFKDCKVGDFSARTIIALAKLFQWCTKDYPDKPKYCYLLCRYGFNCIGSDQGDKKVWLSYYGAAITTG
jgi:hypothetical protein